VASLIIGLVLFLFLIIAGPGLFASFRARPQVKQAQTAPAAQPTAAPAPTQAPPTAAPSPQPSPTSGFASALVTFGRDGINPGQFDDSEFIATDGFSTVYVADHNGGRVQAFDLNGKYLTQWKVGNSPDTDIQGLAADRLGGVFVALSRDGGLYHFDGKTGEPLGKKITNPKGGEYGDLVMTPEGNLAAIWYEGRFGFIDGLKGHTEEIDIFNPAGAVIQTLNQPISTITDEPVLDVYIAIDGSGKLYLLSGGIIYAFSAGGKFVDQFAGDSSGPGQFQGPASIRTNEKGQLLIADKRQIDIFNASGRFLGFFPTGQDIDSIAVDDRHHVWAKEASQVVEYAILGQ
jgi:outer membrane protein assembly factor BamB